MYIRDLHLESETLESTESVDSAQAATVTSHTDWHGIKSAEVKRNLSSLLSPGRVQKEKLENKRVLKERKAFKRYYERGELRKSVYRTDLTRVTRLDIPPFSTSVPTKPKTIPQLNPTPSSGKTSVVRLSLD